MKTIQANNSDKSSSLLSAIVSIAAMIIAFSAAAIPIPLYSSYQISIGLSDFDISLTIVFYLIGVLGTLFIGGQLSDAFGRRPLVAIALIFGIIGCALFALLQNAFMLQLARLIQGISCALTMSATSAFVIDCTSHYHRTLGMTVASTGALIGLTLGSLGIGLFAKVSASYWFVYATLIACMIVIMVCLPLTHETVAHKITLKSAIKPIVRIPANLRPMFPIAAGAYISAWGIGMFFQSLSTPAAVEYFYANDPLLPSLILALAMAPSALGGPLTSKFSTKTSVILGAVLMYASCIALWIAMELHILVLFLLLDFIFGVSTGILLSASMQMLISASNPKDNAAVVSLINFTGYVGSTVLSLIMSALSASFNLALVFALVVLLSIPFIIPGAASILHNRA